MSFDGQIVVGARARHCCRRCCCRLLTLLALLLLFVAALSAQSSDAVSLTPATPPSLELTFHLHSELIAGRTPVGAEARAVLSMATLVRGRVIPAGAELIGEVVESSPLSAAAPARLKVRFSRIAWRGQSEPIELYLCNSYYPTLLRVDAQGMLSLDGVSPHSLRLRAVERVYDERGELSLSSRSTSIRFDRRTMYVALARRPSMARRVAAE